MTDGSSVLNIWVHPYFIFMFCYRNSLDRLQAWHGLLNKWHDYYVCITISGNGSNFEDNFLYNSWSFDLNKKKTWFIFTLIVIDVKLLLDLYEVSDLWLIGLLFCRSFLYPGYQGYAFNYVCSYSWCPGWVRQWWWHWIWLHWFRLRQHYCVTDV